MSDSWCKSAENLSFMNGKQVSAISRRKNEIVIYCENGVGSCRVYGDGKGNWEHWSFSSSKEQKQPLALMDRGIVGVIANSLS